MRLTGVALVKTVKWERLGTTPLQASSPLSFLDKSQDSLPRDKRNPLCLHGRAQACPRDTHRDTHETLTESQVRSTRRSSAPCNARYICSAPCSAAHATQPPRTCSTSCTCSARHCYASSTKNCCSVFVRVSTQVDTNNEAERGRRPKHSPSASWTSTGGAPAVG